MKKTLLTALMCALLFIIISPAVTAETEYKCTRFLPDGNGGFYEFHYGENGYRLYLISSSGIRSPSFNGGDAVRGISVTGGFVMLIAEPKKTQPVFLSEGLTGQHVVFLPDIELSGELIAADRNNIYAVDKRYPKQIRRFSSVGKHTDTIDAGFAVTNLFADESGMIWASGRKGCLSLPSGQLCEGETPQGQFALCGEYCCGSDGAVFRFSGGRFGRIGRYSAPVCCTANGEIYTAKGSILTLTGENGEPLMTLDTGSAISELCASARSIAYISGGNLHIADKGAFHPAGKQESSAPQQSSQQSQPHSDISSPQSSKEEPSSGAKRLESSVYDLSGEYIFVSEGTTAAVFRKNIAYDGYSLQLYERSGKPFTTGRIGTGTKAVFACDGEERDYTLIIRGDVTGEGNINSRDETELSAVLLGENSADDIFFAAADMNGDEGCDIRDLVLLCRLTETGSLPSLSSESGSADITLSAEGDIAAGKAFYVYMTVSADTDAGGALAELGYDPSLLRLSSIKLTDKQNGDTLRTREHGGEIALLLLNTGSPMTSRTIALRFDPLTDRAQSYSFTAVLTDASDKSGGRLNCGTAATLTAASYEQESSQKSEKSSSVRSSKETSSKPSKDTSSKAEVSRKESVPQETETHGDEQENEETISVPVIREPEDLSKRYMLIAGVAVLILAAGAGGYALAKRRK